MRILDISRPIASGEPVYPGNPKPKLAFIRKFKKDGSNLSELGLGLHTASHLDAPLHYLRNGKTVDRLALDRCIGWCRVADMRALHEIGEKEIKRIRPKEGEIILLKTKNSRAASKKFDPHFAYLAESGARALVAAKVKAVGIDGPSIRKFHLRPDAVHPMILRAGIPIYEGLTFRDVPAGVYYFIGLPLNITGAEASPVRAVLVKA